MAKSGAGKASYRLSAQANVLRNCPVAVSLDLEGLDLLSTTPAGDPGGLLLTLYPRRRKPQRGACITGVARALPVMVLFRTRSLVPGGQTQEAMLTKEHLFEGIRGILVG